jgi:TnpA family transposase
MAADSTDSEQRGLDPSGKDEYDQMIKYATALRLGTAQTESILRRFTRNNVQHPTYKVLAELGKPSNDLLVSLSSF